MEMNGAIESFKIILDSCGELPKELKSDKRFVNVPLSIRIGDETIIDDDSFDQASFLKKVAKWPTSPQSSCPSPESYMNEIKGDADNVFIITLSDKLSGSCGCAKLAMQLYQEEYPDKVKNIYVFDSKSASCGETQIALKIMDCIKEGMDFKLTVHTVEKFIDEMHTYFVLETLEHLRKNGRLTGVKALVASTLNIKPVMAATDEGDIQQLDKARGINKALKKMVSIIQRDIIESSDKRLAIAHCNCMERAMMIKDEIIKIMKVKEVVILNTAGISSLYAGDGGIIVTI